MFFFLCFLIGKLFAIAIGGYNYKHLTLPYKLILFLITVAFFCECYGYYLTRHIHKSNVWLFNFYIIVELWFLGMAAVYLVDKVVLRKTFLVLFILNTVVWFVSILHDSINTFATISMVANCSVIAAIYMIALMSNGLFSNEKILTQPLFWLCISTVLYFGCDIPYMGLHNYLTKKFPVVASQLVNINTILDIIRYPLVGISFILLGRQKNVRLTGA